MTIKLPEFAERIVEERKELKDKIQRLENFMETEEHKNITEYEQDMLRSQLDIMLEYEDTLTARINYYVNKELEKC